MDERGQGHWIVERKSRTTTLQHQQVLCRINGRVAYKSYPSRLKPLSFTFHQVYIFLFYFVADDHRETPKVLPVGESTPPTVNQDPSRSGNHKDDVRENLVDTDTYGLEDCSAQEYEIMKDNLLLYNHARLMTQDNHSKEYLVSIMFSHYDQNNNGNLEREELEQVIN